ncbi:MAG TPA: SPOR domain-containing protein [Desulfobacteraceae bacterium]|nr:SPOR domain-containing protein [Desulfobacteraceae bacterium]
MGTAKVIIKYGLYLFIGVWMFTLGVMVGRGTSPVTFDTESFQARLSNIAREFGRGDTPETPVDLDFYDALNNPVRHEVKGRTTQGAEIVPATPKLSEAKPEASQTMAEVPVKTSKKQETFNRAVVSAKRKKTETKAKTVAPPVKKAVAEKPAKKPSDVSTKQSGDAGYTIQVAAYKDKKDAITQMARLEKKGFAAYRVQAKTNQGVWYRVRTGAFADYASAAAGLKKLKQAKIDGMIIKKDE